MFGPDIPCCTVGARHALLHGRASHALQDCRASARPDCSFAPCFRFLTISCLPLPIPPQVLWPTSTLPHTQSSPRLSVTLCVYKLFVSGPLSGYCTRRMRGLQTEFDGKCKVGVPSFAITTSRKLINLHHNQCSVVLVCHLE